MTGPSEPNSPPAPIDLARESDFALGGLAVSPSTREVTRGDWREQLEPRVMQVLVALTQAGGRVVSRDELIARCWEGRVVGEDAINRAIGRLRRLSEADRGASFLIETIPQVGYRLAAAGVAQTGVPESKPTAASRANRRWLLAGGTAAVAVAAAAGASLSWLRRPAPQTAPPDEKLAMQLEQAKQTLRAGNPEAAAQAQGLYQHLTEIAPGSADAWGGLGFSSAMRFTNGRPDADGVRQRAEDAIRHARAIDPHNAIAYSAEAALLPIRGQWRRKEEIYREGLKFNPKSDEMLLSMVDLYSNVGRNSEAARFAVLANAAATEPDPALIWLSTQVYWTANRIAEADTIAATGLALYPRQRSVWFNHVFLLMFTGRTDDALTMLGNTDGRPPGTPDDDFDAVTAVVRALRSKSQADVDTAMAANLVLAHKGAGYAENTIAFAAALGRVDDAFQVADGLYFDRGFKVSGLRFSNVQRVYTSIQDRRTRTLFYPTGRVMQRDPRFAVLMDEVGLTRYWKDAGVTPDYQRS